MAISREHSEVIDQIFVDNREFFIIYNIHTPAFDAAINFNSFEYRINGGIQSASEMLLLKRKPGVARSFNCTPAFVGYASCWHWHTCADIVLFILPVTLSVRSVDDSSSKDMVTHLLFISWAYAAVVWMYTTLQAVVLHSWCGAIS